MEPFRCALVLLTLFPALVHGSIVADFTALTVAAFNQTNIDCMHKTYDADMAVFELITSNCLFGGCDSFAGDVGRYIKMARDANFTTVAALVTPSSTRCKSPAALMSSAIGQILQQGQYLDQIWFEVRDSGKTLCRWSSNKETNKQYLNQLIQATRALNITKIGIFTEKDSWFRLMGNIQDFDDNDLWYPNLDNIQGFTNFASFGGWSTPTMKRYNEGYKGCGMQYLAFDYFLEPPTTTAGPRTTTTHHRKSAMTLLYQSSIWLLISSIFVQFLRSSM